MLMDVAMKSVLHSSSTDLLPDDKTLPCRFERVVAIDPSDAQLRAAAQAPNVEYRQASAEATGVADHTVDLITVGQALHWYAAPAVLQPSPLEGAKQRVLCC